MSEEEQIPDGIKEFLELLESGKKKFQAAELLSQILILTAEVGEDDGAMDRVIEAIISYGDRRVFDAQTS